MALLVVGDRDAVVGQGLRACWRMPLERGWMLVNFSCMACMFPALKMLVPLTVCALDLPGGWATHRVLAIPVDLRARLSAVGQMSMQVCATIGPTLAGLALLHWSVAEVYLAFRLLIALSGLGFLLVPEFKTLLVLDHEQVQGWYGRQHPELFGPR